MRPQRQAASASRAAFVVVAAVLDGQLDAGGIGEGEAGLDVGGRAHIDVVGREVALVAFVWGRVEEGVGGEEGVEGAGGGGGLAGCPVWLGVRVLVDGEEVRRG